MDALYCHTKCTIFSHRTRWRKIILCLRISCKVQITDTDNYCKLNYRLCADGSRMVVGIDYDISYAPIIDRYILLLMITVATSKKMTFYFPNILNIFQSNTIHDSNKSHYICLQSLYMSCFRLIFRNHPLSAKLAKWDKTAIQTIRGM